MKRLVADKDYRVPSGCAVFGIMDQTGKRFSGRDIIQSIALMHERSNGLGGGFAAYGIYPHHKDDWCFHIILENSHIRDKVGEYLQEDYEIIDQEVVPTKKVGAIKNAPLLCRYFLQPQKARLNGKITEQDFIAKSVMEINAQIEGAFVTSSGKNMGIFKGVGYPEDIGEFYRLSEYRGYTWTSHGRFPTNSVGWWGGAHPFGLLDWSVVHNGEISSYGINKRYLENFGYKCSLYTDTEVITYLFDLLARKHKLSFDMVAKILAAPFWLSISRIKDSKEKGLLETLRMVYSSALINGPFAIIVANSEYMVGLNDRIKLRPMVCAVKKDLIYMSSEEAAIRIICKDPDKVWMPIAGEPTIGCLKKYGVKNG